MTIYKQPFGGGLILHDTTLATSWAYYKAEGLTHTHDTKLSTYLGLLKGRLGRYTIWAPQHNPSAIRSWPIQYDLIDAHTRRGTNTAQTLVARIALRNLDLYVFRTSRHTLSLGPSCWKLRLSTHLFFENGYSCRG